MDTENINKLKLFKKNIAKDMVIKKLVLFGSRASQSFNKNSDFDLIIVSDDYKNIDTINRPGKTYDYWTLDYPVDFLCFTTDEIEKKKMITGIISNALKSGVEI
jgi:predicted nucleotidyltransferase